jgi:hypothetical protein
MAKLGISTGLLPDDGNGDSLINGAVKINSNFNEIYNYFGDGTNLSFTAGGDLNYTLSLGNVTTRGMSVGVVTSNSFVKTSGTSSQFLKADGSVDSNIYLTTTGSGSRLTGIVTTIVAGTGITISGSTGSVTINSASIQPTFVRTLTGIHTLSNVGVGTTNPTSTLTVKGNTSLENLNVSGVSTFQNDTYFQDSTHHSTNPTRAYFGSLDEMSIYSTGTYLGNSYNYIDASSGYLDIRNLRTTIRNSETTTQRDLAIFDATTFNSEFVKLYYGGNEKFATLGAGVTVTGTTFTNQLSVSGISTFGGQINPSASGILFDTNTYTGSDTPLQLWIGNSGGARYFTLRRSNGGQVTFDNAYPTTGHNDHRAPTHSFTQTGSEYYALFNSGSVKLYHPGSASGILDQKFETIGTGITVTGTTFTNQLSVSGVSTFRDNLNLSNNKGIQFGDALNVSYNTTNGALFQSSGAPVKIQVNGGENALVANENGSVELYHDGIKKFETTSIGVDISGDLYVPTGTVVLNQLSVIGVSTYSGNVNIGINTSTGPVLTSPNGTKYRLFVENNGTLKTFAV